MQQGTSLIGHELVSTYKNSVIKQWLQCHTTGYDAVGL